MTASSSTACAMLIATGDPTPVEKAVVDGIAGDHEPETFLWIDFHRPDGGVRIWYAWTTGGQPLGDRIDHLAMNRGLDAADWLHIANRHEQVSSRGRVRIKAYALRPVFADVQSGIHASEEQRKRLERLVRMAAETTGQTPRTLTSPWFGFGPGRTGRTPTEMT
ncbi:hypothetical protein ACFV42_23405 [Streptomyces solisilvae]|uniref:hypothetical protein n=1 Tax=Streptomyces malaysiensis TaxID=92644 RepID=UPI0036B4F674